MWNGLAGAEFVFGRAAGKSFNPREIADFTGCLQMSFGSDQFSFDCWPARKGWVLVGVNIAPGAASRQQPSDALITGRQQAHDHLAAVLDDITGHMNHSRRNRHRRMRCSSPSSPSKPHADRQIVGQAGDRIEQRVDARLGASADDADPYQPADPSTDFPSPVCANRGADHFLKTQAPAVMSVWMRASSGANWLAPPRNSEQLARVFPRRQTISVWRLHCSHCNHACATPEAAQPRRGCAPVSAPELIGADHASWFWALVSFCAPIS